MPEDISNLISTSNPDAVGRRLIFVLFFIIILLGISLAYISYLINVPAETNVWQGSSQAVPSVSVKQNVQYGSTNNESTGISNDPFGNWTLYTNEAGFSFKYPSSWNQNGRRFTSPELRESLSVTVNIPSGFECYKRISVENILIGQLKATKENYQGVTSDLCENSDWRMTSVSFRLNSKSINFVYSQKTSSTDSSTFDKITSTIEFSDSRLNSEVRTELKEGQKRYTSEKLGVEFIYSESFNEQQFLVKEIGRRIYVYEHLMQPESGQYIEVFSKDANMSFDEALSKKFLTTAEHKENCKVTGNFMAVGNSAKYPSNIKFGNIEVSKEYSDVDELFKLLDKCPSPYTQSNGISYFIYDTKNPDKYGFVSIGQYIIPSDNEGGVWQDTIRFVD